jgi:hypothetical protein
MSPLLLLLAFAHPADDLDRKVQSVLPTKDEEKWLSINWRLNLNRARIEAQQQNKPMFLWIMNGHPMGCT